MARQVPVTQEDVDEHVPAVAYNPTRDEYLVVWGMHREVAPIWEAFDTVEGRRMDRYGRSLGPAFRISPADTIDRGLADVAWDPVGERYLVVWVANAGSSWEVRGRFIDWNGPNPGLGEFTIATLSDSQVQQPRVAYSIVQRYLVVWGDNSTGRGEIKGAAGWFGHPPTTVETIAADPLDYRVQPDVAYSAVGDLFMVTYSDGLDVLGRTVSVAADLAFALGAEGSLVGTPASEMFPAVATCGEGELLVTWSDGDVMVRAVWDSQPLSGGGPFYVQGAAELSSIACSGGTYLVVFKDRDIGSGDFAVGAATLPQLVYTLPAPFQVRPLVPGESGGGVGSVAVAGGAGGWLVAWSEPRQPDAVITDIRARAVWELFADGFEWGDATDWSQAVQ